MPQLTGRNRLDPRDSTAVLQCSEECGEQGPCRASSVSLPFHRPQSAAKNAILKVDVGLFDQPTVVTAARVVPAGSAEPKTGHAPKGLVVDALTTAQKLIAACGGKEAAKHVIDNVTT